MVIKDTINCVRSDNILDIWIRNQSIVSNDKKEGDHSKWLRLVAVVVVPHSESQWDLSQRHSLDTTGLSGGLRHMTDRTPCAWMNKNQKDSTHLYMSVSILYLSDQGWKHWHIRLCAGLYFSFIKAHRVRSFLCLHFAVLSYLSCWTEFLKKQVSW